MSKKQLRNYTEEAIRAYVDRWIGDTDICQCETCKLDVMAIMLNKMPPKYVVTEKGALYAKLEDFNPQNKVDYMSELTNAVKLVKAYPRHDTDSDSE